MKKISSLVALLLILSNSYGQTNTFPPSGNTGIGTLAPQSSLHIKNVDGSANYPSVTSKGDVMQFFEAYNNSLEIGVAGALNTRRSWILSRHADTGKYGKYYSTLHLQPDIGNKSSYIGVAIGFTADTQLGVGTHLAVNGNVGIGTNSPGAKLHVKGNILASSIKVEAQTADFVFDNDYKLRELNQLKLFIEKNKHLPDIPGARQMKECGVDLAQMNKLLLQKIEELTLYQLQLLNRIEKLEEHYRRQTDNSTTE